MNVTDEMVARALAAYTGDGSAVCLWTKDAMEGMRAALEAAIAALSADGGAAP